MGTHRFSCSEHVHAAPVHLMAQGLVNAMFVIDVNVL